MSVYVRKDRCNWQLACVGGAWAQVGSVEAFVWCGGVQCEDVRQV